MLDCSLSSFAQRYTLSVGLQSDRNAAAGCVPKPRPHWRRFPALLPLPLEINHARQQTTDFSMRGVFRRHWTDRQTDGRTDISVLVTGLPTRSVGGRLVTVAGVCRRSCLSSVIVCNAVRRRKVTHQGAARGGPVVLRLVRATPCLLCMLVMDEC